MKKTIADLLARFRERIRSEDGFSLVIALGALAVTSLLVTAGMVAVEGDIHNSRHDLDGKRAYYAASAGVNDYLYQLNEQPDFWKTCSPNDTQSETGVPGASATGVQYSYQYVLANGATSCSATDPISSLIDKSTGTLQMKFIGYSGAPTKGNAACPSTACRGIIASFRKDSPIDFLWYTVYESFDPAINGYNDCNVFYRNNKPGHCYINWVSGDVMNGPMYTQDQYLINGSPTFGRSQSDPHSTPGGDLIESVAPGTNASTICASNNCGTANIRGKAVPGARTIAPPKDNQVLLTDAQKNGTVLTGTTTITLNGTNLATAVTCADLVQSHCTTKTINIDTSPIIYVQNGCTTSAYSPYDVTYQTTTATTNPNFAGCEGDVYVSGTYHDSLTIAAGNDIIIDGNLTTDHDSSTPPVPTGTAVMGLVEDGFVRVMHGVTPRAVHADQQCTAVTGGPVTNIANQTFSSLTVDAAILALSHSWIVDNFDCGARLSNLTVNGAIAQYYRGPVGTTGTTGYLKNYTYDNRLRVTLPPYLFDISNSGWHIARQTLCVPGGTGQNGC